MSSYDFNGLYASYIPHVASIYFCTHARTCVKHVMSKVIGSIAVANWVWSLRFRKHGLMVAMIVSKQTTKVTWFNGLVVSTKNIP
jgi:hypothetical protein